MLTDIFFLNEQGKRKNLEDSIYPTPGNGFDGSRVFVVCDGVGGLNKGEEASRIACETIGTTLARFTGSISASVIGVSIDEAVRNMRQYADEYPNAEQMSTTLTLAYLANDSVWVAWCGDSRIYHIREGKIMWQSKDHSLVQQLVDAGEITMEQATRHPKRNIILRSLSAGMNNPSVDTKLITDIVEGDYLLLCTDGILENIDDEAIFEILGTQQIIADKQKLFFERCRDKTNDNFSMYLLHFGKMKVRTTASRKIFLLLIALTIMLIGGLLIYRTFAFGISGSGK